MTIPPGEHIDVFFAASPLYRVLAETGPRQAHHTETVIMVLLRNLSTDERKEALDYIIKATRETLN